jgi:hypothetical protein
MLTEKALDWRQTEQARHTARRCRKSSASQPVHELVPEALAVHRMRRGVPGAHHRVCRRLRHPQPRSCGGGNDVDEGGDDKAKGQPERRENFDQGCSKGTLRIPRLLVRAALLVEEWPAVSGRKPIQEECAADQGEDQRYPPTKAHGLRYMTS